MEQSSKVGPRQDEDLKRATRGGEDAKDPHADREHTEEVLRLEVPGAAPDVIERSDLARFLEPSTFPASRDDLIAAAEGNFAPDWALDRLRRLPADATFATMGEVWDAAGD